MNIKEIISVFDEEFNKFKSNILQSISEENEIQKEEDNKVADKDIISTLLYELNSITLDGANSIDTGLQLFNENKEFTVILKATIPEYVDFLEGNGKHRIIDFGVSRIWIDSNGSLCMTTQKNVISLSAFGTYNKGKTFDIIVTNKLDESTNSYKITYYIYNGNKKIIEQYHPNKLSVSNTYIAGGKTGEYFKCTVESKIYNYAFSNEEILNNTGIDFNGLRINNLDF